MTREEASNILDDYDVNFDGHTAEEIAEAFDMAFKALEQEQKTGHWIMSDDVLYRPICDKCGAHPWKGYIPTVKEATEVFKFCPNCGCLMDRTEFDEYVKTEGA